MNWDLTLNFLAAMIAILNPFGKIPVWTELTSDKPQDVRKTLAFMVSLTGLILLLLFLFTGSYILEFFKIDLASFLIAGGILLLITAVSMVQGKATHLEKRDEEGDSVYEIAKKRFRRVIVPLVVPIIAGPGSITTVIIYGMKSNSLIDSGMLAGVVFIVLLLVYIIFLSAKWFEQKLDETFFVVITRIFGLLLAAIAVQFIVEGIGQVFPALLNGESVINDNIRDIKSDMQ